MTRDRDVDPLLGAFSDAARAGNGLPDEPTRADRRRCLELLQKVLHQGRITTSPLGSEWTEVFDVQLPVPPTAAELAGHGWLPMDGLLGGGRRPASGTMPRRWAVVENGRVLAGLRLLDGPADEVATVLDRCAARGQVRLADVLELRELRRQQRSFPLDSGPLRVAAEIESGLGGRELAPWATGRSARPPVDLPRRRRGPVIAVSGVDGSGKSTLRAALVDSLERAGIPVSTVWVRPGMGLGRLTVLAAKGKRLLRQDARPGLRAMADPTAARPASRKGAVGWVWAMLVTLSFLNGVRRQHRAAVGVVLYDRHLVDALATLGFAYEGVDLRLPRRLVRSLLPRADVLLYLDVPAEVSVARKPDDLLGEHAVRRQLTEYGRWLDRIRPTARLDATHPAADLVAQALQICSTTTTTVMTGTGATTEGRGA
jgi:thymidylate kinase